MRRAPSRQARQARARRTESTVLHPLMVRLESLSCAFEDILLGGKLLSPIASPRSNAPSQRPRGATSSQGSILLTSRGLTASELRAHELELWWSEPPWLHSPPQKWPPKDLHEPHDHPVQRLTIHGAAQELTEPCYLLTRYSSLTWLQRIMVWCQRFLRTLRFSLLRLRKATHGTRER